MRLRLLPVLIVAAGLTLTVRVGGLWYHQSGSGLAAAEEIGAAPDALSDAQIEGSVTPQAGTPDPDAEAQMSPDETAGTEAQTAGEEGREDGQLSSDPFALTDTEIDLLQKLAERRAEIEQEAAELEDRRLLLEAAESRVDQKLDELKALQAMIQDLLLQHEEQEEKKLLSLVKIYESMKPKDAARIFEQLDMPVLLEVIGRMKERKTAPVLAMMDPEKAKAVTLELANRQALPIPKD